MELSIRHAMRRFALAMLCLWLAGCTLGTPTDTPVIVITATFPPSGEAGAATPTLFTFATALPTSPAVTAEVATSPAAPTATRTASTYTVQPGDTLSRIAAQFGVSVNELAAENGLTDPNRLQVGQVLRVLIIPQQPGIAFRILPDDRLVRAPGAGQFNISAFVAAQPGYIRSASDRVDGVTLSASQVIERVSLEYSVDARLLLALLEHQSNWLSRTDPDQEAIEKPIGAPNFASGIARRGLYLQLAWAADALNRGYYAWQRGAFVWVQTIDQQRFTLPESLNPATVGIQHTLAVISDGARWRAGVSEGGLNAVYVRLFGDPFIGAREPVVPANIVQPVLTLPFAEGETWLHTGGPHGGWGSGSAWAAVDFAPPDDPKTHTSGCYVSNYFVTAPADGVIARSGGGSVILDLDGDGDETTGWTILFLHLAERDRIAAGVRVRQGDRLGRPSCEGGFSNGTHVHIARRYNGEWIPASCDDCRQAFARPPFVMGGWQVVGLPMQEYQGYLIRDGVRRVAEQMRGVAENEVSW